MNDILVSKFSRAVRLRRKLWKMRKEVQFQSLVMNILDIIGNINN